MIAGMEAMMAKSPTRGENLAERLRRAKQGHYECEDCWYSCATITCNEDRHSDKCDCGAVIYELPPPLKHDQALMPFGKLPVDSRDLQVVPDRPCKRGLSEWRESWG